MSSKSQIGTVSLALGVRTVLAAAVITFVASSISAAAQDPPAAPPPQAGFPVSIVVDAAQVRGGMKPFYRFFGADRPTTPT